MGRYLCAAVNVQEIEMFGVCWIHQAQDRDRERAVVNVFHEEAGNFLTS
jgi:hypothetical protein